MTEQFPLPLKAQLLDDRETWRLLEVFIYHDVQHGRIEVPAHFDTDFASVRPLRNIAVGLLVLSLVIGGVLPVLGAVVGTASYGVLALYASVVGYGHAAATIHDHLYETAELSRKGSDRVFYHALRASGMARWRAWLMYVGVRLGGHWRYARQ